MRKLTTFIFLVFFSTQSLIALPIDWSGSFGVDTIRINDYRRIEQTPASIGEGAQLVDSQTGEENAHFQSYIFRLAPTILINDAVSFKGEISSGYARGGFLGDNTTQTFNDESGLAPSGLYAYTTSSTESELLLNQAYLEIYSDLGLYRVGRFPMSWGLGAIWDAGEETWDRFFSLYDGVQLELNFGKFMIRPHWAKLASADEPAGQSELTRETEMKEMGIAAVYDSPEDQMKVGIIYASRKSNSGNTVLKSSNAANNTQTVRVGFSQTRLIDVYAQKQWGDFKISAEVPLFSGEFENPYGQSSVSAPTDFQSSAYLLETSYALSPSWEIGIHAGMVSGDDGSSDSFEALYLHPNYQIAHLLFRYNWNAFSSRGQDNIFDASITNATYAKFFAEYSSESWTWNLAAIWAKANEVAQGSGQTAYNHETAKQFTSQFAQGDSLGTEVDLSVTYRWTPSLKVTGELGMQFLGDYYEYSNAAGPLEIENPLLAGLRLGVDF